MGVFPEQRRPAMNPPSASAPELPRLVMRRALWVAVAAWLLASIERIGARLGLTSKTAANYQTLVRHKLGVATSIELLRVAERRGLVVR